MIDPFESRNYVENFRYFNWYGARCGGAVAPVNGAGRRPFSR